MIPDRILKELRSLVGRANVLDKLVDLQTYAYDAYLERSLPGAVVFVRSCDDVAGVVKVLHREGLPFAPRGCGTNLSGGSLALQGGVLIEMSRMNRILEIDVPNQRMVAQPGVFNLDLSTALGPFGYYYAPDPASQKACSLGGNVAENAGGPHCFKYGVTSNHVLGIEVVLPDGEVVWFGGKSVDAPGLDLTGLFVGSEGTLGIVTTVVLRIMRKPEAVKTMLAVYDSIEAAGNTVSAIVAAGLVPATLELMDNLVIQAVEDAMACGFPRDAAAVLLIELDGLQDGMEEMTGKIIACCEESGVREIRVAADETERTALWKGRKGAFGAVSRLAPNYLVADGTVPRTKLPEALRRVAEVGRTFDLRIASVFHAGDGNLHPTAVTDERNREEVARVHAFFSDLYEKVLSMGGTVSGEHGIGIAKKGYLLRQFGKGGMEVMRRIKKGFDPDGRLNPGKIFLDEEVPAESPIPGGTNG